MMYVAVSSNKDNVLSFLVWNKALKAPHSYWPTLELANEVAIDLNKSMVQFEKAIAKANNPK